MINYTCYTPKRIPSQDLVSRSEKNLNSFMGCGIIKKGWTIKRLQTVNSPLGMFSKSYLRNWY